ncbi:MAG: zinc-ribbon domain-containing transport protein, partial [Phycisphaerales bacterium]|nr:zinc-ribbon domain-containing transport protein [Phycisphaerales bacterium]
GGGGNNSGLVYLIIWLLVDHPAIGIPTVIVIGIGYYFTHTSVKGYVRGQRTQRGLVAIDANREAEAIAALQQRDTEFSVDRFYARVQTAFVKVQDAWCKQNLTPVRPFVSDGVHERFSLQFSEQKEEGYHDQMDDLAINSVQMAQLTSESVFDAATVRIDATSTDRHISLADGHDMPGADAPGPFAEYWTFLRRRGAKTTDKDGLIEGNCPNCGAAIELNAGAQCSSCHALLRSGQYDWVLVEISQESEWRPEYPHALPGVAELQLNDPDFDIADLEDRVSVMFWRKCRADRLGKIDPLRKVATANFCDFYSKLLLPTSGPDGAPHGPRSFWGDCAVGGLETHGVIRGEPMDRALVEVRWSGLMFQASPPKTPVRSTYGNVARHLYVLVRTAGVKTNAGGGISSAHCPNCGAPISDDSSDACRFCGTVLNDGTRGWVLEQILPMTDAKARDLLMKLAMQTPPVPATPATLGAAGMVATPVGVPAKVIPEPVTLLAWAVQSVTSGSSSGLDASEMQMLQAVAQRCNISSEQLRRMLDAAQNGRLATREPMDAQQAEQWLGEMMTAALAGGDVTGEELRLFNSIGTRYRLSAYDVGMLLKRQKNSLYNNAVEALRYRKLQASQT